MAVKKKQAIPVEAVVSFVSKIGDKTYRVEQGQELPLPEGADWLDVGFVVVVRGQKKETATVKPAEKATRAKSKSKKPAAKKTAVDKVMGTGSIKE